eukprot:UN09232
MMTKERPELVIYGTSEEEVTADTKWLNYDFYSKVGNVNDMPIMVSPFELPLDWSLWFVPLRSSIRSSPWIFHLLFCLCKNDKNVLTLIKHNPFPIEPPKHVRIEIYHR